MNKTFWLVSKFIASVEQGVVWDFQGIFETRDLAIAACRNESYSIQSVELNEELPDESSDFPDCEYPKRQG
jgi:hypothetical protein